MSRVHSISTFRLKPPLLTEAQRLAKLGPFAERWGNVPKGVKLPATHVLACPRVKVSELPADHIPSRYIEALEHNQQIASCCRHPENHEIEAFKSHPDEVAPDIYVFHCTCGRKHRRFCVGAHDERPFWAAEVA
jgi:hypothetical protein